MKIVYLIELQPFKYMNNFRANYDKILGVLKSITEKEHFLRQNRNPKLKDIELIAMNLFEMSCHLSLLNLKITL